MTETTKDYNLSYQHLTVNGVKKLRAVLHTKEFGPVASQAIFAREKGVDEQLLNSLADELIDAYEERLVNRPVVVPVS